MPQPFKISRRQTAVIPKQSWYKTHFMFCKVLFVLFQTLIVVATKLPVYKQYVAQATIIVLVLQTVFMTIIGKMLPDLLLVTSFKMVKQLVERCQGRKPCAVFHADCAVRGRASMNRILKDEIIHRMQYPLIQDMDVPWLGLYGFGEFAQLGGKNRFHTFTTSLFVILKKE